MYSFVVIFHRVCGVLRRFAVFTQIACRSRTTFTAAMTRSVVNNSIGCSRQPRRAPVRRKLNGTGRVARCERSSNCILYDTVVKVV